MSTVVRATFKRSALPRSGVPKSSRAPGAQVRGPSRLASPTVRPRVFDLPDAQARGKIKRLTDDERTRVHEEFKAGEVKVLVCTTACALPPHCSLTCSCIVFAYTMPS